jgi:hypothetical protein
VLLGTGGAKAGGVALDQRAIVGIYIGVEILIGLLNTFSTKLVDTVGEISGGLGGGGGWGAGRRVGGA